ncbi:hypothetical protein CMK12_01590 [Candidatus Poribacteria bacterium]|nr:hypothetical protein [Candidatus Poribacteria bacterium]
MAQAKLPSDRNLGRIWSQIPCSSHGCKLHQRVLADGYRSGQWFHLAASWSEPDNAVKHLPVAFGLEAHLWLKAEVLAARVQV